jgi:hypothetical protein
MPFIFDIPCDCHAQKVLQRLMVMNAAKEVAVPQVLTPCHFIRLIISNCFNRLVAKPVEHKFLMTRNVGIDGLTTGAQLPALLIK